MSESSSAEKMSAKGMISRFAILLAAAGLVGFGGSATGAMTVSQSTACAVFIAIIFGTLFFWGFRLAIAFLGLAVLIFNKSMDIPTFVSSSSLEVIIDRGRASTIFAFNEVFEFFSNSRISSFV